MGSRIFRYFSRSLGWFLLGQFGGLSDPFVTLDFVLSTSGDNFKAFEYYLGSVHLNVKKTFREKTDTETGKKYTLS